MPAKIVADGDDGPQLLTFVVGDRLFGCPLADVREIIPQRATTRLPGAPSHVVGLLNLRGTLLTVLDLTVALGAPDRPDGTGAAAGPPAAGEAAARGHVLVVETDGRVAGCRVDAVRRVHPMPALLPLAPVGAPVGNAMPPGIVLGMGDAGDAIVAVLDLPALVRQTLLFPGER